MYKNNALLVFAGYILTISNSFGLTLSCSYLDTFNSENILTFFFRKDQDRYKYFYKGQERFSYIPLVDDEKKLVLGIFWIKMVQNGTNVENDLFLGFSKLKCTWHNALRFQYNRCIVLVWEVQCLKALS